MRKVRIPLMIHGPTTKAQYNLQLSTEGYDPVRRNFLDGPTTRRVAVVDLDPETGALQPPLRYNPRNKLGCYETLDGQDLYQLVRDVDDAIYAPEFMQVSAFATVLRTIDQFEKEEEGDETRAKGLGRRIEWAFPGSQLFVVPRAGKALNAFYERDSSSLQFFYSPKPVKADIENQRTPSKKRKKKTSGKASSSGEVDRMVYTCLSRDIIAHEAGHAIIDGIAPDLMDASTVESLAIHEAVADLTALLVAFSSHTLQPHILEQGKGSINVPSYFTSVAEELGMVQGHSDGIRNLLNDKSLAARKGEQRVDATDPHELSQVLSGALYCVLVKLHEQAKSELVKSGRYGDRPEAGQLAAAALRKAVLRFKQMVYRGLDCLPPGEVSFADLGRAMIAVDRVAYPKDKEPRGWIREEFRKRAMAKISLLSAASVLVNDYDLGDFKVASLHPDHQEDADALALDFAMTNRKLLNMPSGVLPSIRPRLEVLQNNGGDAKSHQCIFKVAWSITEDNDFADDRYPRQRRVLVGTTLLLDWDTNRISARLTTAPPRPDYKKVRPRLFQFRQNEYERQSKQRSAFLRRLASDGLLKIGDLAHGPDKQPLQFAIEGRIESGSLRVRRTANLLHIAGYHPVP